MEIVLRYVINYFIYGFWTWFLFLLLDRRFSKGITVAATMLLPVVYMWLLLQLPAASPMRIFCAPAFPVLVVLLLYRGKLLRRLFVACIPPAVTILAEILMAALFPESTVVGSLGMMHSPAYLMGILFYLSFEAGVLWCMVGFLKKRSDLLTREWGLFVLFPLSQVTGLAAMIWTGLNGLSGRTVIGAVVILALFLLTDFAMLRALRNAADKAALQMKNEMLDHQLELQKSHYEALTAQYEDIRRMRHDIADHLQTVQALLQNGENAQAEQYAQEIARHHYLSKLGQCENPIVDAFLYDRCQQAQARGVQVEQKVQLPAQLPVDNADLICLFGNIMDNAMEACTGADQRKISISAVVGKGVLLIKEENTYMTADADAPKKKRIASLERGVGFRILEQIARRYNGQFSYERSADCFQVIVSLEVHGV